MLVHQSQAGCIIGRAGFKIKQLREVRTKESSFMSFSWIIAMTIKMTVKWPYCHSLFTTSSWETFFPDNLCIHISIESSSLHNRISPCVYFIVIVYKVNNFRILHSRFCGMEFVCTYLLFISFLGNWSSH